MNKQREIFVTNALPYANGDIHLGHLVGYIQADIWVRFQRLMNHTVHYVCADDTHGTPIMLKAEAMGITPEALIAKAHASHYQDFKDFHVDFDNYYTTHSEENRVFAEKIYLKLVEAGLIATRTIEQLFDEEKQMFLPDRFVKGECPKCHAQDQYGDNCEVCGAAYQPTELINPFSVVSGKKPVMKESEHFFFKLSDPRCVDFLRKFLANSDRLQSEAANKMKEWIGEEGEHKLSDWDISRDAPYFGFPIPNAQNKYFYVWLDAPIGYFASLQNLSERDTTINIERFIDAKIARDANTEMVHFIGKDILYFHTLFWPAMLEFSGYRVPSMYAVNGFLTVDGAKMSKSRGTFITARSYLDQKMNPEWLRYYFAAKSSGAIEDVDLNLEDFVQRINSDLVGKFINIAARASGFIAKRFNNTLTDIPADASGLISELQNAKAHIIQHYDTRNFAAALREISGLCDSVNAHVDMTKPWELARDEAKNNQLHGLCSAYLEAFRILTLYLKPVLPTLAAQVEAYLNVSPLDFSQVTTSLTAGHQINDYQHLMKRIEAVHIEKLVAANTENLQANPNENKKTSTTSAKKETQAKTNKLAESETLASEPSIISIDDFSKVDLRLGKVLQCGLIDGSDKLLQFSIDLGEPEPRTIFSGIRSFYQDPAALIGTYVIVVANLAPRKMRFGISQGMILSAVEAEGKNDIGLKLLSITGDLKPGSRVS